MITDYAQQSLQTLNLIYYIPTALFALIIYFKNKNLDYKIGFKIILWGIIPTIVSAFVANIMDTSILRKFFAIYVIAIGCIILLKSLKKG